MAFATYASGNPTIGTSEYSLAGQTTTGVPLARTDIGIYQLVIDVNAIAAGDIFRVRFYERGQSGGTSRIVLERLYEGPQGIPLDLYPALLLGNGWDITIVRTAGTDRAFPYTIWRII